MSNQYDSGIQCSALNARFHQLPPEPRTLKREFQHTDDSLAYFNLILVNLICIAKNLVFNAKLIQNKVNKPSRHLLPAIAIHEEALDVSISIVFTDFNVNNSLATTFPRG